MKHTNPFAAMKAGKDKPSKGKVSASDAFDEMLASAKAEHAQASKPMPFGHGKDEPDEMPEDKCHCGCEHCCGGTETADTEAGDYEESDED